MKGVPMIRGSKKKQASEKPVCYVLITCGAPGANGEMQVEMTYEGDKVLASYLVESAQSLLEAECDVS